AQWRRLQGTIGKPTLTAYGLIRVAREKSPHSNHIFAPLQSSFSVPLVYVCFPRVIPNFTLDCGFAVATETETTKAFRPRSSSAATYNYPRLLLPLYSDVRAGISVPRKLLPAAGWISYCTTIPRDERKRHNRRRFSSFHNERVTATRTEVQQSRNRYYELYALRQKINNTQRGTMNGSPRAAVRARYTNSLKRRRRIHNIKEFSLRATEEYNSIYGLEARPTTYFYYLSAYCCSRCYIVVMHTLCMCV
ncbi:unnamed protein product, partial [Trichogramma brassicae]